MTSRRWYQPLRFRLSHCETYWWADDMEPCWVCGSVDVEIDRREQVDPLTGFSVLAQ